MGKTMFLGLLLVLGTVITMTNSFVHHPSSIVHAGVLPAGSKESSSEDEHDKNKDSSESFQDKEQMLCNVVVRATHDLYIYRGKSMDEITTYLNTDCQNLETKELIEQCREIVTHSGSKIYEHVKNGMEMSQICQKLNDGSEMDLEDEGKAECSREHGNKCKCCEMHVQKRKMRLRYIVKQMAKKHMCMCKKSPRPDRCRRYIRRQEQQALKRIQMICPYLVCKHLGYCEKMSENNDASKFLMVPKVDTVVGSSSLWPKVLDQQLEAHLTQNICGEFKQLQALCVHVAASVDSKEYARMYMAVLQNDTTWIAKGLREKLASLHPADNTDLCGPCKNVIQSSTTFYLRTLETVHNALISSSKESHAKEDLEKFFNNQLETFNTYLHSLKSDEFCSAAHLCSSASSTARFPVKKSEDCTSCVQRLQPRKEAALQAINLLSVYFTDLCKKMDNTQCQQFVSEMLVEARSFIGDFDVQETCSTMGFCGQNNAKNIDDYERAFVEEIGKQVCTTLGPFETLCQQVVQGDSKQVQMVNLNGTNFDDFFHHCEEETDEKSAVSVTEEQCSPNKDKCQCCIARVVRKKKCLRKRVAKYVRHMIQLCKRCPVQEKCEQYWEDKKACWDAKIDKICPKKACIRMGYCPKPQMSSVCAYMGAFKQVCEQALNTVGQSFTALTTSVFAESNDGKEKLQPKDSEIV